MKNFKKVWAIIGVILLLAVFCLPMVFALSGGENAAAYFRASLAAVILVPILAWAILVVYRHFNANKVVKEERMIENIIFDVGNVLMKYGWEPYLKSYGFPEEKYEKIADAIFRSNAWNEQDRALYETEEYVRQFVAQAPEYEEDIREVYRRAPECLSMFDYAETWTAYLKNQGYHLYILSNYGDYMLEHTKEQMRFLKHMDGVIFSCQVREIKPEPAIFRKLLETYHLDPEKSVFLDDLEANCRAAKKQGIHTIQFRNFKQAAAELEKLGVK